MMMKNFYIIKKSLLIVLLGFQGTFILAQDKDSLLLSGNKEPIVYQVGYGTRTLSELTTAVSVVRSAELSKPLSINTTDALAGKAAGLTVLKLLGDEPGYGAAYLYIRGIGSQNNMRAPYILIDDVERSFNQLDIAEIESITILKDGASNAQYGQRGANGTILIKTKRGFEGKPEVHFISQIGTQQPTKLPRFLGSKEYVTFYNKAIQNDGLMIPPNDKYNPDIYNGSQDPFRYPDVDWYNEFLNENAMQQQYKLTFRGGTKKVRYFMLLGYLNQQGLYNYSDLNDGYNTNIIYDRINVRTNLDANVTKDLLVSLDVAGKKEDRNMPNVTSGDLFNVLSSLLPNAMPVQYNDTMLAGTSQYRNNPLGMISRTGYRNDRTVGLQIKAKATLNMDVLLKGLKAETAFGYDGLSTYGLLRSEKYATYELQSNGSYTKYGEYVPLSLGMQATGKQYEYLMSFYGGLNYNQIFNRHHLGASLRYYQAQTFIRGDNPPFGKQGINGGASYSYNKRYFVDFSFSYDGSDEFAPGHRFGFFPAVSAGWLLSNEEFLKENKIVTFLKLRASYGEAGNCKNDGLDRYAYQSRWSGYDSSYGGYIFGTGFAWSDGAWEGRIANPNLTWETTHNTNVGIDISLLHKLTVNVDGFIHNRDNIIMALSNIIPSAIGAPSPYANIGKVTNKGFETTLTYHDSFNKVNFYVQGNASFARNEIKKTDESDAIADNLKRTGHSITQTFGMLASGYYKNAEDIANSPYNSLYSVRPGDIKYVDINNDNIINSQDEVAIGSPQIPEWTLGLSAGVEYAGLDFSFLLSGYAGRSVILDNPAVWVLQNNGNVTDLAYGAWEAGVREDNATYPRLTTESNKNNYRTSSYWQKNGSFLRVSNIELGYSFPQKWIQKVKMQELRLYVNGQNLLTFDHLGDFGVDPEVLNAGITGYPMTKALNVGLSIKF